MVLVIVPSDLLKNKTGVSFCSFTKISKGNWGSAKVSLGCKAPDVWVEKIPAVPSEGEETTVFVVDFEIKYSPSIIPELPKDSSVNWNIKSSPELLASKEDDFTVIKSPGL